MHKEHEGKSYPFRLSMIVSVYLSPLLIHSTSGSGVKADLCDGYDCSVQILGIFYGFVPFTRMNHIWRFQAFMYMQLVNKYT